MTLAASAGNFGILSVPGGTGKSPVWTLPSNHKGSVVVRAQRVSARIYSSVLMVPCTYLISGKIK